VSSWLRAVVDAAVAVRPEAVTVVEEVAEVLIPVDAAVVATEIAKEAADTAETTAMAVAAVVRADTAVVAVEATVMAAAVIVTAEAADLAATKARSSVVPAEEVAIRTVAVVVVVADLLPRLVDTAVAVIRISRQPRQRNWRGRRIASVNRILRTNDLIIAIRH